ncbi:MAG: response regulator [Chitinispirillaceae bacterium]|nr:response regulator [Chitinispirillaceae bacterium]
MDNKKLSVVVVDDEIQITDLLKTFLQCISKNLDIHTFNDPEEARAHLLRKNPDVLITDFKMPKYDGIQLIRLMPNNSTKVLISGYVSEITEGQLGELKASFFEKPVPMKDLGRIIAEAQSRKGMVAIH